MQTLEELLNCEGKILCFDIDGTITKEGQIENFLNSSICEHNIWFSSATPNKKVINIVNSCYYRRNTIIFYTTRDDYHREATEKWMRDNDVLYHHIIFRKPYYDMIIDDKAINVRELI